MIVNILRIDYDCLIIYKVNVFFCKMFFYSPKILFGKDLFAICFYTIKKAPTLGLSNTEGRGEYFVS
jgi:hypothetical protein